MYHYFDIIDKAQAEPLLSLAPPVRTKPVAGSQLLGGTAEKFSEGDVFVVKK